MGASIRVLRQRIKSVEQTKKITKAMELIASARIMKAQTRTNQALPYTRELYGAISAAASHATDVSKHPLLSKSRIRERAIFLVITSDRGLAGGYSSGAIKEAEGLTTLLKESGMREVIPYVVGKKAESYYRFRDREMGASWTGFTDQPEFHHATEIARTLLPRFLQRTEEGGADEIHIVYTHFEDMGTQYPRVRRILPLEVVDEPVDMAESQVGSSGHTAGRPAFPLYSFEPSPEAVLDQLLPKYIEDVVYAALLMSATSEHAARRRAMKAATDNAEDLIKSLSRQANAARQSQITQEISEIVGGADALTSAAE